MMDVDKSLDEMIEVILNFALCDFFPFFHHLIESMVVAQFEDDVHILAIFEDMIEKKNIFVF